MSDTGGARPRAKVFLSYKRSADPDEFVAGEVIQWLERQGHEVFIDKKLKLGQEWATEIERQVCSSDYLVVLLSELSCRSEMVRGEIEIARKQEVLTGRPQVLPVRVAFEGALPYPLNAWLDKLQYAQWHDDKDSSALMRSLTEALAGQVPSTSVPLTRPESWRADLPPPYAAKLPPSGGTLAFDDPSYLSRPSDATALTLARQPGQTLIIRGPRQMGKSSLLMRTVAAAADSGKRVALLDFQLLDDHTKRGSGRFFRRLMSWMSEELDLADRVQQDSDDGVPDPQNCTRYMERYLLPELGQPVCLAIDEADAVFGIPFQTPASSGC